MEKHEYLKQKDYYENKPVGSGRKNKMCQHCEDIIEQGVSHDVHYFLPEFQAFPTHKECTEDFINSLND